MIENKKNKPFKKYNDVILGVMGAVVLCFMLIGCSSVNKELLDSSSTSIMNEYADPKNASELKKTLDQLYGDKKELINQKNDLLEQYKKETNQENKSKIYNEYTENNQQLDDKNTKIDNTKKNLNDLEITPKPEPTDMPKIADPDYDEKMKQDTDGDGLSNFEENNLGTDPTDADSDGDGLSDGHEVHTSKTDPLKKDTDNDDVDDNSDDFPNDPAAAKDTDKDGYPDSFLKGDALNASNGLRHIDAFPENVLEWLDTDEDGVGDNSDNAPNHHNPGQKIPMGMVLGM